MGGKKAKGVIETQESSHRRLHLSLSSDDLDDRGGTLHHVSNGGYQRLWWNPKSGNDEDQDHK